MTFVSMMVIVSQDRVRSYPSIGFTVRDGWFRVVNMTLSLNHTHLTPDRMRMIFHPFRSLNDQYAMFDGNQKAHSFLARL